MKTDWSPAATGGVRHVMYRLTKVHSDRLEFRAATGVFLACVSTLVVGIGCLVGWISSVEYRTGALLTGGLLCVTCGLLLYIGTIPRVFDREAGVFWIGRRQPTDADVALGDIHAIQLLAESVKTRDGRFQSYEINLVLEDGSRVNVTDHGGREIVERDAEQLSTFLDRPLWNAL